MPKLAVAIVISLLAGLAVGTLLVGDHPDSEVSVLPPAELANGSDEERLLRLEQMLFEEREARVALEDSLALVFEELEDMASREQAAGPGRESRRPREVETLLESRRRERSDWMRDFNERRVERLIAGGFSEVEARNLIEQESAARYEAMRAAWEAQRGVGTQDPNSGQLDPQRVLRESIGDDAYERYLRAEGQPTAIQVMQVLSGSPGARVGIEPGDEIARYNGERVFSISDLRELMMQSSPGEDVVVEIMRDGVAMQLTLPAGPIGVTGNGARMRGINWWGG